MSKLKAFFDTPAFWDMTVGATVGLILFLLFIGGTIGYVYLHPTDQKVPPEDSRPEYWSEYPIDPEYWR